MPSEKTVTRTLADGTVKTYRYERVRGRTIDEFRQMERNG